MHVGGLLALLVVSLATRSLAVVVVTIDSINCSNLTLSINATQREKDVLPNYMQINIQKQSQTAMLPSHDSQDVLNTTVQFQQPFVLPDGTYPVVIDMITSLNTNNSVAAFSMPHVAFKGCYASSTSSATSQGSTGNAVASASINGDYLATASPTTVDGQKYLTPLGVPTHSLSISPGISLDDKDAGNSGLDSSAKIGITVGVLGLALLAVLAAMAVVLRRWNQKQHSLRHNNNRTHSTSGWMQDEDRNGAELKEVHSRA